MSSRFKSGAWSGSRNIGPKKIDVELDLKFHNGTVEGNGTDEIGEFNINGTYEERPPFSSKLLITYFGQESMEFNGYRESEGGGIFLVPGKPLKPLQVPKVEIFILNRNNVHPKKQHVCKPQQWKKLSHNS